MYSHTPRDIHARYARRKKLGQIFGTVFYVAYVIGQLRSISCTCDASSLTEAGTFPLPTLLLLLTVGKKKKEKGDVTRLGPARPLHHCRHCTNDGRHRQHSGDPPR
jgi:hypothetical protein